MPPLSWVNTVSYHRVDPIVCWLLMFSGHKLAGSKHDKLDVVCVDNPFSHVSRRG